MLRTAQRALEASTRKLAQAEAGAEAQAVEVASLSRLLASTRVELAAVSKASSEARGAVAELLAARGEAGSLREQLQQAWAAAAQAQVDADASVAATRADAEAAADARLAAQVPWRAAGIRVILGRYLEVCPRTTPSRIPRAVLDRGEGHLGRVHRVGGGGTPRG